MSSVASHIRAVKLAAKRESRDPASEWANTVRAALIVMNKTNRELADMTGLGHSTIGRFVNGEECRCDTFQCLAKFCGYEMVLKRGLTDGTRNEKDSEHV